MVQRLTRTYSKWEDRRFDFCRGHLFCFRLHRLPVKDDGFHFCNFSLSMYLGPFFFLEGAECPDGMIMILVHSGLGSVSISILISTSQFGWTSTSCHCHQSIAPSPEICAILELLLFWLWLVGSEAFTSNTKGIATMMCTATVPRLTPRYLA